MDSSFGKKKATKKDDTSTTSNHEKSENAQSTIASAVEAAAVTTTAATTTTTMQTSNAAVEPIDFALLAGPPIDNELDVNISDEVNHDESIPLDVRVGAFSIDGPNIPQQGLIQQQDSRSLFNDEEKDEEAAPLDDATLTSRVEAEVVDDIQLLQELISRRTAAQLVHDILSQNQHDVVHAENVVPVSTIDPLHDAAMAPSNDSTTHENKSIDDVEKKGKRWRAIQVMAIAVVIVVATVTTGVLVYRSKHQSNPRSLRPSPAPAYPTSNSLVPSPASIHATAQPTTNATMGTTLSNTKFQTNYICTLFSKWSASRQPINFPANPTFFTPILVAASSSYQLWAPNSTATQGLYTVVLTGATDQVINEINSNGDTVIDYQEGSQQNVNILGFQTLPPITVDRNHSYLTSITPISPSPDWFHGFYQFNTINSTTNTFYDSFAIDVYPWDLGTQTGSTYLDSVSSIYPYDPIFEYTVDTVPSTKVFLDPTQTTVLPVATWTCTLQN